MLLNNLSYFFPLPLLPSCAMVKIATGQASWDGPGSTSLLSLCTPSQHSQVTPETRVLWAPLRVTAEPNPCTWRKERGIPRFFPLLVLWIVGPYPPRGNSSPPASWVAVCVRHVSEGFLKDGVHLHSWEQLMFHEQVRAKDLLLPLWTAWARIS